MKFFILSLFAFLGLAECCFTQDVDSNILDQPLRFRFSQLYVPSALIGLGILTNDNSEDAVKFKITAYRNEHLPDFQTKVDEYLPYTPIAITYGLDAFGVPAKSDFWNRSAILVKGELLMAGTVYTLKKVTHQLRPDQREEDSFPSGHTAQAFAAATFLSEEYRHRFKWMPYLAYGIATSVGVLRIANNEHYISDVLVAAGIGMLSMKISYWTHQYKWGKRLKNVPK